MSNVYKASAADYQRNRICRACHDAGLTEAQTIEALAAENDRLMALAKAGFNCVMTLDAKDGVWWASVLLVPKEAA